MSLHADRFIQLRCKHLRVQKKSGLKDPETVFKAVKEPVKVKGEIEPISRVIERIL